MAAHVSALSRRQLLRGTVTTVGGLAGLALLAACGGAASGPGGATAQATTSTVAASASATVATTSASTASASATTSTAAAVTTASVAATGAPTTSAATSTVAPTSSSVASSVQAKGVTLTYVSPDTPGRFDVERAIFAAFTKDNPGIAVEIVSGSASWGNVEEKLKASIAGGQPINLFQNGWGYWSDVQAAIMEFTSYMARDKLDPQQIFVPLAVRYFTQDGKLWALPVVGISIDALAYNQDLLDAAGITAPSADPDDATWTMDKFLEYAQKLTKADQLQFGFGGSPGGDDTGGQERPTYFGLWPWDDQARQWRMAEAPGVQGLQFFKDLRDKYQVQPNATQVKSIGAKGNIFTSGKIGMQVIYGYIPKLNFRWGIAPLPHAAPKSISGRQYAQALQATKTPLSEQTWTLGKWLMVPAHAAQFPLSAHYAVSPVIGASAPAIATYKEQIGVDPSAFQAMTTHSDPQVQERYAGWNNVSDWMGKNFPLFDQGKLTAADYAKAATDYINANLLKG